jgi:hypothetical protein
MLLEFLVSAMEAKVWGFARASATNLVDPIKEQGREALGTLPGRCTRLLRNVKPSRAAEQLDGGAETSARTGGAEATTRTFRSTNQKYKASS